MKAEAVEAIGVTAGLTPGSLVAVQSVDLVTHLGSARHMGKNVFTATKRDILWFKATWQVSWIKLISKQQVFT